MINGATSIREGVIAILTVALGAAMGGFVAIIGGAVIGGLWKLFLPDPGITNFVAMVIACGSVPYFIATVAKKEEPRHPLDEAVLLGIQDALKDARRKSTTPK
jgi:hypothetical protein